MSAKVSAKITFPVPPSISYTDILSHLHTHRNIISKQQFIQTYDQIDLIHSPTQDPAMLDSDFSTSQLVGHTSTYLVSESVPVVPMVYSVSISFPVRFQNTVSGVRSYALAPGGVKVKAEWSIIRCPGGDHTQPSDDAAASQSHPDGDARPDQLVLVEHVHAECSSWMKWFVGRSMKKAHSKICQSLIQDLEHSHGQSATAD